MSLRSTHFDSISDEELLKFIKAGKESAYMELFERHWERLYVIAQSILKDEDTSKDLLQDVFLSFWERRGEIEARNIGGYLAQSVRFAVYKELRDGKLTVDHEEFLAQMPSSDQTDNIEFVELREQIDQSILDLPERCREVFTLSRYEHLTNKEIAEQLGLSQRTVETHISNALKHLKKQIHPSYLLAILPYLV